jgi:hypothetical protein
MCTLHACIEAKRHLGNESANDWVNGDANDLSYAAQQPCLQRGQSINGTLVGKVH